MRARQRIGPAAGKPDDREPLDPERLRELAHVVGELDDRAVGVRRRGADPPLDRDHLTAYPSSRFALPWDLSARPRGTMEPEDGASRSGTELCISELPTVAEKKGPLEARWRNRDHPRTLPQKGGRSSSRPRSSGYDFRARSSPDRLEKPAPFQFSNGLCRKAERAS